LPSSGDEEIKTDSLKTPSFEHKREPECPEILNSFENSKKMVPRNEYNNEYLVKKRYIEKEAAPI
jgi:hypothetical protein